MNITKIKKIAVIISLLTLIGGANGAVAVDFGSIQVTVNPANSTPIDNELNAMIVAVLDGDAYLNEPGEYIPDENFTGAQGKTFTVNNVPLNGTNTYTIAVAFFKEQQKSVDYGLYTVSANGTALAPGTQSGSFMSNILGTRVGNTVSYAISIARSNPTLTLTTTPPSLTNQNSATIVGTTRKNSLVTVTGGAAAASTVANASGGFSLNVTLNQNVTNALQVKATDTAGAISNIVSASVTNDNTAPIITLSGANPQTIEVGSAYTELGATATDSFEGNITGRISINTSAVNTNALGSYTVRYNVTDSSGNAAVEKTRTVNVMDTTRPVIIRIGISPVTAEAGTSYTDAGATATDNYDGNITASIVAANPVNVNALDSYTVRYNTSDSSGNAATEVTRIVNVADTTKPVITRNGSATVTIEYGSAYVDAGATASDSFAGNLTANIVVVNPVNTNALGNYTVRYNVTDLSGNAAIEVTRTVQVVDTTKPVITRLGTSPINHEAGTAYTDAGATAADNVNGNITASIIATNPVNANVLGAYTVRYNVTDASGNTATEITRTVNVVDTTIPVIALMGDNPQTVEFATSYIEQGATASDNYDGNITANIVINASAVNINALGNYTIAYNVSDSSGNSAAPVTRTVNVTDTIAPNAPVLTTASTTINADSITVTGTAEADSTITITGGATTATGTATGGNFSILVNLTQDAANTLSVTAKDASLNVSLSSVVVIVEDSIAPNAPTITTTSKTINANSILITGNAEPHTDLSFTSAFASISGVTLGESGDFEMLVNLGQNTVNIISVRARDKAGNVSSPSSVSITEDSVSPAAPLLATLPSPINTDTIAITGVVEAGTILTVYEDSGMTIASGTADAGGNFSIEVPLVQDTANTFGVMAEDAALNESDFAVITVVEDSTPPGAPTITTPDQTVNANFITIEGTAEAGSLVAISNGGVLATTTATGGVFSILVPLNQNAVNQFGVGAADAAGNISSNSPIVTIIEDSTPPELPIITSSLPETAINEDSITITGTAEPSTRIKLTISVEAGTSGGAGGGDAGIVDENGNFTINVLLGQDATTTISIFAKDGAENESEAATVIITEDSTPPTIPVANPMPAVINNVAPVSFTGTAESGSLVILIREPIETGGPREQVGAETANASGNFVIETPLNQNSVNVFRLYGTDIAGNSSAESDPITITEDSTPPGVPTASPATGTYNAEQQITLTISSDATTVRTFYTTNGTEPNETSTEYVGVPIVIDGSNGTSVTLHVISIDEAGNEVAGTEVYTFDKQGPEAPTADITSGFFNANQSVTLTLAGDADATFYTLDGAESTTSSLAYTPASQITIPGTDGATTTLEARSFDALGNAGDILTENYVFDFTDPVVSGVTDGEITNQDKTISFDGGISGTTATLNGNPFTSGEVVSDEGTYTLIVTDGAGNSTTISFEIDKTAPPAPVLDNVSATKNAASETITGTAEANTEITATSETETATTTADGAGNFTLIISLAENATNTIAVTSKDAAGNTGAPSVFTIQEDSTAPTITILGNNPETVEFEAEYIDAGATALDSVDGDRTANIATSTTLTTSVTGTYTVTYNVSDSSGNTVSATRTVEVVDTTKPVITLNGSSTVTIEFGDTYADAGATASDNYDGNITAFIVTSGTVNTNVLGEYTIAYNVTDSSGNTADEVTRTVNVVDTTAPVITLLGSSTVTREAGLPYADEGATATDNVDGDISMNVVTMSTVNTDAIGDYEVRYNVSDSSDNPAVEVVRTVLVRDTIAPVIALTGDATVTTEFGLSYVDAGATVTDSFDPAPTLTSTSTVNTSTLGTYFVTYDATDASGNIATSVTRTVNVTDTIAPDAPVITTTSTTLNADSITIVGKAEINSIITITGGLETATGGNFSISVNLMQDAVNTLQVTATDASGNVSSSSSLVIVEDSTNPIITGVSDGDIKKTVTFSFNEGEVTLNGGPISILPGTPVTVNTEGVYVLVVTDSADNQTTVNFEIDTTPPPAPSITTPSQTVNVDSIAIEGTAEASSTITITGGLATATGTATGGNFSVSVNLAQNAANTLLVTARDIAGNVSSSSVVVITEDSTPPDAPTIGSASQIVNADSITIEGTTEADSIITITGGAATATGTADGTGSFSVNVLLTQDAANTLSITATDIYNNESLPSLQVIMEDSTPPAAPIITTAPQTINADFITIEKTAETNSLITITGGFATATGTATGGSFSISVSLTQDAVNTLSVTATDSVNNESSAATVQITEDSTAPNAPTITTLPQTINANALLITGTAEANASMKIMGGTATATGAANGLGNYLISVLLTQDATNTFSITATDAAGNVSSSSSLVIVEDSTPPVITITGENPVIVEVGSAYVDAGATANDTVAGNLTANITTVTTVTTSTTGTYSVTYEVSDTAGNTTSETRTVSVVDTTAPVITLVGSSTVTMEFGGEYHDAGASAEDNVDGDISANINSEVTTHAPSFFIVTYSVSDSSGNAAIPVTRTVMIVDTTPPVITLIGSTALVVEVNTSFSDPGTTAFDIRDGDITGNIITTSTVNTGTLGIYEVRYNVSDSSGNPAVEVVRTVNVTDTIAPAITLVGSSTVTIEVGSVYVDAGATASDNHDGDVTASIITTGAVNTAVIGNYEIRYNVSDGNGNAAQEITRTVEIVDTTKPVITLNGSSTATIEFGDTYADAGATASDNYDGDITASIVISGTVNTNILGENTIRYNVIDSSGNAADEVVRTVQVVDTTAPVITLIGPATIDVEASTTYTDAGATASDNVDSDLTASITTTSTVNTTALGTYSVTFNVSDSSGNAAEQVTRTVNVVDTTSPVITLLGNETIAIEFGSVYTDTGATALDNLDGDITGNIITTSTVNTGALGTYSVTYGVSDSSGNAAIEVVRTVIVGDTTKPVITLVGQSTVIVEFGNDYVDEGATALDNADGDITASITTTSGVTTSTTGTYSVTYGVSDSSGNAADIVTRTVEVVDTTVPAGLILNPVTALTNVTSQTISGAKEANSSVLLGGTEIIAIDGTTTWSYNLALSEGVNTISLTSKDVSNNESAPVTSAITLDTEKPTVSGVTNNASYSASVTPVLSDNLAVASATLNGTPFVSGTEVLDEGAYELIVTDTAGNTKTVTFTLDFTTPATPVVNPVTTPTNVTSQTVTGTKDANTSVWIDGAQVAALGPATAWSINIALMEGDNTLIITARDSAGNVSSSSVIVIVRDTTGPVAPIANVPAGNYNGAISITLTLAPDAEQTFFVVNDGEPTVTSTAYIAGTIGINGANGETKTLKAVSFDALGNRGNTMSVNYIFDTEGPVITLNGSSTISIEQGRTYADEGATATDAADGGLTANITTSTTLNNLIVGTYTLTYSVTDSAGNTGSAVRTIQVTEDITPPTLTILEENPFTLEQGETYTDEGAEAVDLVDGDITDSIIITNPVNTDIPGTYTVIYRVVDAAGNTTENTRTVIVQADQTAPVITLTGSASVEAAGGSAYNDAGATASDNIDGILTDNIIITNPVNTDVAGAYTVRYNVADIRGNAASEVMRGVNVANDVTAPVITINGENPVNIELKKIYIDKGASASDAVNGVVAVTAVSTVNTEIVGSYTVTYTARDASGNAATAVRTVNVTPDVTAPVITLIGGKTINVIASSTYADAGATALDNVDGDITTRVVSLNPVNAAVIGTYTVSYNVTDSAGNEATEVTRTVNVIAEGGNATIPVITLTGSSTVEIAQGAVYEDAGATALDDTDGDITANIITSSTANTSVLGEYTVTYNVTDAAGNAAEEVVRRVRVVDVTAPMITLLGQSSVNIKKNSAYTDDGATASDDTDGDISAGITSTSTVNTATAGAYAVTYDVSDSAGNAATPAVRTVNVNELSTPVLANLTPTNSPLFILASSTVQMVVDISDADDLRVSYNVEISSSDPDTNHWPVLEKFTPFEPTTGLNNFNAIGTVKFTIRSREFWNNATLTITARDRDGNEAAITRSVRTRP